MKIYDERIEQRVLSCAENFIFHKGLHGWSMDQLAMEAGLAKNTLYKIVGSKEKLLQTVIVNKIRNTQSELQQMVEKEEDYFTALDKIVAEFPRMISLFSDRLKDIYNEYPAIEEQVICHRHELTGYFQAFIQRGKDSDKLRADIDPSILIQALQAVLLSFVKQEAGAADFQHKMRVALRYIIYGIKK